MHKHKFIVYEVIIRTSHKSILLQSHSFLKALFHNLIESQGRRTVDVISHAEQVHSSVCERAKSIYSTSGSSINQLLWP